jgi:very-short-patch-repair endonuclease
MSFGIDKLCEQIAGETAARVAMQHECWKYTGKYPESPIELLFLTAINEYAFRLSPIFDHPCIVYDERPYSRNQKGDLVIQMQVWISDWPVDFVLYHGGAKTIRKMVVECDGHEFHERTKEQAARDRSRDRRLQAMGYQVFRFTGSELWRNPLKCIREVDDWFLEDDIQQFNEDLKQADANG